jgi:Tol biopolymer transport system component
MHNKHTITWILMTLLAAASVGCEPRPETTPSPQIEGKNIIQPTETERAWVTIAPGTGPIATATTTMQPINTPLQGRIAFQSDRDGSIEIYVMNADGSAVSRLTNNPAVDVFPAWSPDGARLAFASDRDGAPNIYLVDPDGTNLQRLTNSAWADIMPVWANIGREIAFISNRDGNDEIYIYNLNTGLETRVTDDPSADYFPTWSPDGEWIAFTTDRDINPEIYKVRRDGTDLTRLTDDPGDDANPAWSPDGTRIAFTSNRNGFYELYTMSPNGDEVRKLSNLRSLIDEPTWSPDSAAIAFSSNKEGQNEIYAISADGSGLNRLTDLPAADFYPAWSPLIGFLDAPLVSPTGAPEGVCVNASSPDYGFSPDNPIKIGYDPRGGHEGELSGGESGECLPWLLGPQGQPIETSVLEEMRVNGTLLCKVAVSYSGKGTPDILYFDIFNYEQPKAPLGYSCGSPVEYLKSITEAIY